jgi:hypothetical protein
MNAKWLLRTAVVSVIAILAFGAIATASAGPQFHHGRRVIVRRHHRVYVYSYPPYYLNRRPVRFHRIRHRRDGWYFVHRNHRHVPRYYYWP